MEVGNGKGLWNGSGNRGKGKKRKNGEVGRKEKKE
jgi:hypothetical protein